MSNLITFPKQWGRNVLFSIVRVRVLKLDLVKHSSVKTVVTRVRSILGKSALIPDAKWFGSVVYLLHPNPML